MGAAVNVVSAKGDCLLCGQCLTSRSQKPNISFFSALQHIFVILYEKVEINGKNFVLLCWKIILLNLI